MLKKKLAAFMLASFMSLATVAAPAYADANGFQQAANVAGCYIGAVPLNPSCWAAFGDFYNDWIQPQQVE